MSSHDVASLSREALLFAGREMQFSWLTRAYGDLEVCRFYPHGHDWLEDLRELHRENFGRFFGRYWPAAMKVAFAA